MIERRIRAALLALLVAPALGACARADGKSINPPGPGDVPQKISIPASNVTLGVTSGPMRRTESLDAFQITKHPVTVAQFRACVGAGACTAHQEDACLARIAAQPFDRPTVNAADADALPATCAGVAQARAFCAWAGGKLPTSSQFLLAARGPTVTRFSWGDTAPTCNQRPDAASGLSSHAGGPCSPGSASRDAFSVGSHPAGASPFGVEDVLLTPGELVDVSTEALATACVPPLGACVVYGVRPGAIEFFEPLSAVDDAIADHPYGFRCAWN